MFLRRVLHDVDVAGVDLDCHGSLGMSDELLDEGVAVGERVECYCRENGARWATYAIWIPDAGRVCRLYGPAARQAMPGDRITITTWEWRKGPWER